MRDEEDGKKKKTKKTSTATGGKGPMISGGISASKEAEMLKQQLKQKGVVKGSGA